MASNQSALWPIESEKELSQRTVAMLIVAAMVVLGAAGLLFVARRAMGAFTTELAGQTAIFTAILAFAIITGLRILWRRTFPEPTASESWIGWGASLALVLLAAGLNFPTHQNLAWLVWIPLLLLDQGMRARMFASTPIELTPVAKSQAALSAEQLQQIVRTRDAVGRETIRAALRADFQAGQRHAALYIGFCPPLAAVPEINVECHGAQSAELKIVQALAHGARIDVRLGHTVHEPTSFVVTLLAESRYRNDAN